MNNEEKICRICQEGENENKNINNPLIRPCLCNGGIRYVHRDCLDKWRVMNVQNAFYRCEICHYEYRLSRVWWASLLESSIVIGITSLGILGTSIYISGSISSLLYNKLYYWFMHQAYKSPHRLSVLFHGLFYVGGYGMYNLVKDMFANLGNVRREIPESFRVPNINITTPPWWWYNNNNRVIIEDRRTGEKKEEKKGEEKHEEKDKKSKSKTKTKVAEYESHSSLTWLVLLIGASGSLYYLYNKLNSFARRVCSNVRQVIENVPE